MKAQSVVSAMIVFWMISSGCSSNPSTSPPSSGGGGGAGGSGGTTGSTGGSCGTVTPCGGDVLGTWDVKSSCLQISGTSDISYLGLACLTAEITGTVNVTGTLTLDADGKYTDNTVTKGSDSWALGASCLDLSGTHVGCDQISNVFAVTLSGYGYEEFKCVDAASGGGCTCQGKINSTGGLGLLYNDLTATGKYTSANNTLSIGDALEYSYCVKGTELTVTPKPGTMNSTPYAGTVVLQNSGGGNGGAGGGGGTTTGSGGAGSGLWAC